MVYAWHACCANAQRHQSYKPVYKTNVELGVNQTFAGILGNRRVQQASISNQRLVVTVLP
jgi:hypothetical protein